MNPKPIQVEYFIIHTYLSTRSLCHPNQTYLQVSILHKTNHHKSLNNTRLRRRVLHQVVMMGNMGSILSSDAASVAATCNAPEDNSMLPTITNAGFPSRRNPKSTTTTPTSKIHKECELSPTTGSENSAKRHLSPEKSATAHGKQSVH